MRLLRRQCATLVPAQAQQQEIAVCTPPCRKRVTPDWRMRPGVTITVHDIHCAATTLGRPVDEVQRHHVETMNAA